MVREIRRKKRSVYNLIIIFFFCVFFLLPTNSSAAVNAPFKSVTGLQDLVTKLSCNSDSVAVGGGAYCCLKLVSNTQSLISVCQSNMCWTNSAYCKFPGSGTYFSHPSDVKTCTVSGDPYLGTAGLSSDLCYQNVNYTEVSNSTSQSGVIETSRADAKTALTCGGVAVTSNGGDYCGFPADASHCLLPLQETTDANNPLICCKALDGDGKYLVRPSEAECTESPKPKTCNDGYQLSNETDANSRVCCKTLTATEIAGHCVDLAGNTTSTCTVTGYKAGTLSFSCSVTINVNNTQTTKDYSTPQQGIANNSDPNNPNGTNGGTVAPDTTPKSEGCGVNGSSTNTAADCCKKNAATISDATKAAAEEASCNTCLKKGANYSWSGLGCINTSTEGIVLSILRIFYGIGTGLLVLRIVIAGIKLINNPDSPDTLKDSKQEVTSSILAFVFGVLSLIILRFIGINVLGITWIDGLLPKLV